MLYKAIAKNIKISPRKMRLVVDAVKKLQVDQALIKLSITAKRAGIPIKKVIESAIANAVNNFKAERTKLAVREITITEGITYKRFHFAARGRTRPYKKRTSHITVILEDKVTKQIPPVIQKIKELPAKIEKEKKPSRFKKEKEEKV